MNNNEKADAILVAHKVWRSNTYAVVVWTAANIHSESFRNINKNNLRTYLQACDKFKSKTNLLQDKVLEIKKALSLRNSYDVLLQEALNLGGAGAIEIVFNVRELSQVILRMWQRELFAWAGGTGEDGIGILNFWHER